MYPIGQLTLIRRSEGVPEPDGTLQTVVRDKIWIYRQIYLSRPDPIAFMTVTVDTLGSIYDDFSHVLFLHVNILKNSEDIQESLRNGGNRTQYHDKKRKDEDTDDFKKKKIDLFDSIHNINTPPNCTSSESRVSPVKFYKVESKNLSQNLSSRVTGTSN